MLQFEELRLELLNEKSSLDELGDALDIEEKKKEIAELEAEAAREALAQSMASSRRRGETR